MSKGRQVSNLPAPNVRPHVFGLGFRFLAALGGMAAMTLAAGLLTLVGFGSVRQSLDEITGSSLNTLELASRVSRVTQTLDADSRSLVLVTDEFALDAVAFNMRRQSQKLDAVIQDLEGLDLGIPDVAQLKEAKDGFAEALVALEKLVRERIRVKAGRERALDQIMQFGNRLTALEKNLLDVGTSGRSLSSPPEPLQRWLFAMSRMADLLMGATGTENVAKAQRFRREITDLEVEAQQAMGALSSRLEPGIRKELDELIVLGKKADESSLQHINEMRLNLAIKGRLTRIVALSKQIVVAGRRIADAISQQALNSAADQKANMSTISNALIVLSILCIIGALLILTYINRSIFRRLSHLRSSMLSHVKGEPVAIDARGKDEVSDMAKALQFFVDEIGRREGRITEKNQMLESLSNQLAKYLSPQVYESIFSGKQEVKITSRRKKLTVFFSDIAGFTETTDNLESEELTNLLNHYLTEMSKIALEYGATIDKYIGDAIMSFFGDPDTRGVKEDAIACVKMAIAMQRQMRSLEQKWRDRGLERPFQIRIGINTGFCTVGNFGSEDRMDYTIIGSEVNLAARLESSVELGGILMAHETYSLVKDIVVAEEQAPLKVKGFVKPVRNYKVVGAYDELVEQGRILRKEKDGIRIEVNLDKQDKAAAIGTIEDFLSELKD